jgi:glutathione peroxidase
MSEIDVRNIPFANAKGEVMTLNDYGNDVVLVVNVASKCGLTPQYEKLEQLQREFADQGFTVLGFPCNQFMGQEPGSVESIIDFCSMTYGVTFPINNKVKVNGKKATGLYKALKKTPDAVGEAGRVSWNFEKFLVGRDGKVTRFRPKEEPDSMRIVEAIQEALAV